MIFELSLILLPAKPDFILEKQATKKMRLSFLASGVLKWFVYCWQN